MLNSFPCDILARLSERREKGSVARTDVQDFPLIEFGSVIQSIGFNIHYDVLAIHCDIFCHENRLTLARKLGEKREKNRSSGSLLTGNIVKAAVTEWCRGLSS